ncbi:MmpS family transport accessory protein [Mycobacterium sp. WMMD1722]|uniref:MmpS family transport accessory protein n=1 Tax=Mycobacterium sp. WMMD1722 TaxID=3404117 RepID=UPI003BF4CE59
MSITAIRVVAPTLGLVALIATASVSLATADPPPPGSCDPGSLPRDARPGDDMCVSRDFARRTAQENADPAANKAPGGGDYGPETCLPGFVWREAFAGDTICVTPDIRAQNLAANANPGANKSGPGVDELQPTPAPQQAASRTVTFEVTGAGTVYAIEMDPPSGKVGENTGVPFTRTITIGPDVELLQVIAIGKTGSQGCRILLDGRVVAEQPVGNSHCSFAP